VDEASRRGDGEKPKGEAAAMKNTPNGYCRVYEKWYIVAIVRISWILLILVILLALWLSAIVFGGT